MEGRLSFTRFAATALLLLLLTQGAGAWPGSGTSGDPYLISSTEDWNLLADNVNAGTNYAGKYFRQTGNFTVSSKIIGYPTDDTHFVTFNGIYDGNGCTINAAISKSDERYVAPFHCIANATIKNVIVTGNVAVSGSASIEHRRHPAGLVGVIAGTCIIQNCRVSANVSGCDYLGGIVGHSMYGNLTMTGCVYTGTITASGTNYTGGLIGWGGGASNLNVSIENCLFAGSYSGSGKFHPVGCYYTPDTNNGSVSNTYYTVTSTMNENDGNSFVRNLSDKGKMRYSITAGTYVTISGLGTATAAYDVSGITAYGTGIKYNDVYYAGGDESVSISLSHAARAGYTFSQYTVSGGGSLTTPSTFAMSAANQTINSEWTVDASLAIPVSSAIILGETKYVTTFYNGTLDYKLPAGALAYTAGKDGGKVVFYRIGTNSNVIPHGTAVIIVADELALTEGKVTLTKITAAGVTPGINILTGSDTDVTKSGTVYVLGKDGSALGFYPLDGNTVPAGRAYYVE